MKKIFKKFFNIETSKSKNFFFGDDIPLNWIQNQKKSVFQERILILIIVIFIYFICIIGRLFYLACDFNNKNQNNKNYTALQNKKSIYSRPTIVDRKGDILATSILTWDLYAEPEKIVNAENSAKELVKILPNLKYDDLIKKLKSNKKFYYIARKISPLEKEKITLIGEPGFNFYKKESRAYPHNNLFSHIIGTTNIDNKGISGIEKYIDQNKELQSKEEIQLSIDIYIQDAIRQALSDAIKKYNAKTAAGIIMDVKTGEVLGMVSLPDFHNNNYGKIVNDELYNNHVSYDVYEMGSVMKIFNTALALENNYPTTKLFDVYKKFMIGNHSITDSHPKKRYLNIIEGFMYSSNIVMANIAKDLGVEKQKEFLSKLNLLNKINFELPEIGTPLLPKNWNEYTSASIGFGYSLSPTMLNVIAAVNGIINDGFYIEPTILKRTKDSLFKSYQIVSQKTSSTIKLLMRLVITNGTGYMANLDNVLVGGKTGTSKKIIKGIYDNNKIRTFFVSIFPAENPKYTMLIMLDEAKNNNCDTAACTAVPISAKIIDDISPILNLDLKIN